MVASWSWSGRAVGLALGPGFEAGREEELNWGVLDTMVIPGQVRGARRTLPTDPVLSSVRGTGTVPRGLCRRLEGIRCEVFTVAFAGPMGSATRFPWHHTEHKSILERYRNE